MANAPINDTEYKAFDKEYARSAWLKRQQRYWDSTKGPRFNTHIGEIYEVDFGMNIGDEFSGRHLALCLSDTTHSEERMTVIPLSTKYMEYNLQYEIHVTSYVDDKPIDAGVVLDEPRLISKLRVAQLEILSSPYKGRRYLRLSSDFSAFPLHGTLPKKVD